MVSQTTRRRRRRTPLFFVRAVLVGATVAACALLSPITDGTNAVAFVDGFSGTEPWLKRQVSRGKINSSGSSTEWILCLGSARTVARGGRGRAAGETRLSSSPGSFQGSLHKPFVENISIEYCPGCRWMTKAFWMASELLQNSALDDLKEVTVIPSEPGTFNITARVAFWPKDTNSDESESTPPATTTVQLWDRKADGGFPPIDLIEFQKRFEACLANNEGSMDSADSCDSSEMVPIGDEDSASPSVYSHVVIKYCPSSGYLLRAAYYGQELLTTFCEGELDAMSLKPIQNLSIGGFSVELKDRSQISKDQPSSHVLWDKSDSGRFPEVKELKRLVRDRVTPQKDLGHSEDKTSISNIVEENSKTEVLDDVGDCIPCNAASTDTDNGNVNEDEDEDNDDEFLDDDAAEEVRRYFGVM